MLLERGVVSKPLLSERDVVGIMLSERGLVTKLLLSDFGGVVYIVSEGWGGIHCQRGV